MKKVTYVRSAGQCPFKEQPKAKKRLLMPDRWCHNFECSRWEKCDRHYTQCLRVRSTDSYGKVNIGKYELCGHGRCPYRADCKFYYTNKGRSGQPDNDMNTYNVIEPEFR